MTEGGVDEAGLFHKTSRIDDSRLAELFAREVLADLVRKELLSPEWAERLLSWQHMDFNVHTRVRAKTKKEAGLAVCLRSGRSADAALAAGREILAFDPDHFDALYVTGDILARQKSWADAVTYFERALRIEPENAALLRSY